MTELATPSVFKKDYMPGYTGHVPTKADRFGASQGQIKREILNDRGCYKTMLANIKSRSQNKTSSSFCSKPATLENKLIYGNLSIFAKNWVAGPTHEIRDQHIPGYTGHLKGLVSENLHSDTFGNTSFRALYRKHPVGHDVNGKERFLSENQQQYTS
jgi:hypothetical protein